MAKKLKLRKYLIDPDKNTILHFVRPEYCDKNTSLFIKQPVLLNNQVYEYDKIKSWIQENGVDPLNRQPVSLTNIEPATSLYHLYDDFFKDKKHKEFLLDPDKIFEEFEIQIPDSSAELSIASTSTTVMSTSSNVLPEGFELLSQEAKTALDESATTNTVQMATQTTTIKAIFQFCELREYDVHPALLLNGVIDASFEQAFKLAKKGHDEDNNIFTDPITKKIITMPVILGQRIYDFRSIVSCIQNNSKDPITGVNVTLANLKQLQPYLLQQYEVFFKNNFALLRNPLLVENSEYYNDIPVEQLALIAESKDLVSAKTLDATSHVIAPGIAHNPYTTTTIATAPPLDSATTSIVKQVRQSWSNSLNRLQECAYDEIFHSVINELSPEPLAIQSADALRIIRNTLAYVININTLMNHITEHRADLDQLELDELCIKFLLLCLHFYRQNNITIKQGIIKTLNHTFGLALKPDQESQINSARQLINKLAQIDLLPSEELPINNECVVWGTFPYTVTQDLSTSLVSSLAESGELSEDLSEGAFSALHLGRIIQTKIKAIARSSIINPQIQDFEFSSTNLALIMVDCDISNNEMRNLLDGQAIRSIRNGYSDKPSSFKIILLCNSKYSAQDLLTSPYTNDKLQVSRNEQMIVDFVKEIKASCCHYNSTDIESIDRLKRLICKFSFQQLYRSSLVAVKNFSIISELSWIRNWRDLMQRTDPSEFSIFLSKNMTDTALIGQKDISVEHQRVFQTLQYALAWIPYIDTLIKKIISDTIQDTLPTDLDNRVLIFLISCVSARRSLNDYEIADLIHILCLNYYEALCPQQRQAFAEFFKNFQLIVHMNPKQEVIMNRCLVIGDFGSENNDVLSTTITNLLLENPLTQTLNAAGTSGQFRTLHEGKFIDTAIDKLNFYEEDSTQLKAHFIDKDIALIVVNFDKGEILEQILRAQVSKTIDDFRVVNRNSKIILLIQSSKSENELQQTINKRKQLDLAKKFTKQKNLNLIITDVSMIENVDSLRVLICANRLQLLTQPQTTGSWLSWLGTRSTSATPSNNGQPSYTSPQLRPR